MDKTLIDQRLSDLHNDIAAYQTDVNSTTLDAAVYSGKLYSDAIVEAKQANPSEPDEAYMSTPTLSRQLMRTVRRTQGMVPAWSDITLSRTRQGVSFGGSPRRAIETPTHWYVAGRGLFRIDKETLTNVLIGDETTAERGIVRHSDRLFTFGTTTSGDVAMYNETTGQLIATDSFGPTIHAAIDVGNTIIVFTQNEMRLIDIAASKSNNSFVYSTHSKPSGQYQTANLTGNARNAFFVYNGYLYFIAATSSSSINSLCRINPTTAVIETIYELNTNLILGLAHYGNFFYYTLVGTASSSNKVFKRRLDTGDIVDTPDIDHGSSFDILVDDHYIYLAGSNVNIYRRQTFEWVKALSLSGSCDGIYMDSTDDKLIALHRSGGSLSEFAFSY